MLFDSEDHQNQEKYFIINITKNKKFRHILLREIKAMPNWLMNYDIDMYNRMNYHCSVMAGKESDNIHRT